MSRMDSIIARTASRLEGLLYHGGWPVRLARAIGIRPEVRTVNHAVYLGIGSGVTPPLRIAYASDFHAGPTTDASGPLSRRYVRGRFSIGNGSTLIVSVGLGCVVLPLRTFADPEIVICTLSSVKESS